MLTERHFQRYGPEYYNIIIDKDYNRFGFLKINTQKSTILSRNRKWLDKRRDTHYIFSF